MENKFSKWKIFFPNGKLTYQMANLFPKWKINFANGKFYFPNGKSISRMENLFPKWKINFPNGKFNFPNGKFIFQMEIVFLKWKINFPNGKVISQMENPFPKREILFQTSPADPLPIFSKVMTYQFFNPLRSRGQIAQWQSRRLPRERHRFESGLSPDRLEVWWYGGGGYWAI